MKKILFVCTGSICRSPMAEAVFRHQVEKLNLPHLCDSAGTHGYHIGDPPDHRTIKIAQKNNVPIDGLRARKIQHHDFTEFDLVLGMDSGHVQILQSIAPPEHLNKIKLFMNDDVADPYYGDIKDFILMYEQIKKGTDILINSLSK